ncbi:PIG-L family deacetylase [Oleiharenicola sp. Vm1]|uniref:PIG-L family deacetylase n=1 Tax=Oleiharenicola sp. Vm1 TaxID=3398393 RepID=UPI0039F4676B
MPAASAATCSRRSTCSSPPSPGSATPRRGSSSSSTAPPTPAPARARPPPPRWPPGTASPPRCTNLPRASATSTPSSSCSRPTWRSSSAPRTAPTRRRKSTRRSWPASRRSRSRRATACSRPGCARSAAPRSSPSIPRGGRKRSRRSSPRCAPSSAASPTPRRCRSTRRGCRVPTPPRPSRRSSCGSSTPSCARACPRPSRSTSPTTGPICLPRFDVKASLRLRLAALMRGLLAANSRPLPLPRVGVLVVAPHADDETLGCGALLAALAAAGAPAHVAFVSDSAGAGWSPGATHAERAARRRAEALAALAALGLGAAHATFLDAPDGELDRLDPDAHARVVARLAERIAAVRARHVFLPLLGEGSTEHDAAVWLAREALSVAGATPVVWEYPVWAWWNALRLRRQLLRADENFSLAAAPWRPACRRALACHASQLPHLPAVLTAAAAAPVELYFRRPASRP